MIQRLEWQRQGVGVLGHSKTLKGGTERGRKGLKEGRRKEGRVQKKKERKMEKNYLDWRDGLGLKVCAALAEVMSSVLPGTRLYLQLFWSL